MSNMSYCRFEKTSRDLADCARAIEDREFEDISRDEVEGLKRLLKLAARIVEYDEIIEEAIEIREEELKGEEGEEEEEEEEDY